MKTNKINAIKLEYGELLFNIAVIHLFSVGYNNMKDPEFITASCELIRKTTKPGSIMTADFQVSVVECAAILTQFPVNDLFLSTKDESKWTSYLYNAIMLLVDKNYEGLSSEEIIEELSEDIGISEDELDEIGMEL